MRDTVVVFARAPRLGTVKRRLARDIGDRAALRFHTAVLTALLRDLMSCRHFDVVLAITPDRAPVRGIRTIPQGRGDLGIRMSRALARFRRVALIGCDIPAASASDVRQAFRALGTADAVFGPAADGGFWLIALGPRRPSDLFGRARWSTENALADTLLQFRHHRIAFIRTLTDVDTGTDYRQYLSSLAPGSKTDAIPGNDALNTRFRDIHRHPRKRTLQRLAVQATPPGAPAGSAKHIINRENKS